MRIASMTSYLATSHIVRLAAPLLQMIRDTVVPPVCLACDSRVARQGGLCARCWPHMRFIDRPFCEVLGIPFPHEQGAGAVSPQAMADPPPFDRLRSCVIYDERARALVSGLKFSDRGDLAPWMAGWMAIAGRELAKDCSIVVPVPLHWRRLHERRYNQSAELARMVARSCGLTYLPLALVRHRATERQVGLSAKARARNVQGAFRVPPERRPDIEGAGVLVIDDVYTTGATVRACARALKRAGAARVDVLTFASVTYGDI
jgi:ComF family protein